MRQHVSTKTQGRVKQQHLKDPHTLTDEFYRNTPTFRAGGLVTPLGMLQLLSAFVLLGYVFGGAMLFCIVVLMVLGLVLLHHSEPIDLKQGMSFQQAINRLYALRRSVLDYSLTLSIAQSQQSRKNLHHFVSPASFEPKSVVASTALESNLIVQHTQNKLTPLKMNQQKMNMLPAINFLAMKPAEYLWEVKRRAHSEPKQLLRCRPLLPLLPKMLHQDLVQHKYNSMIKTAVLLSPKVLEQQMEIQEQPMDGYVKPGKVQQESKAEVTSSKDSFAILLKHVSEVESVVEIKVAKAVPPTMTANSGPSALVVTQLSVYPKPKPLVEIAYGEPAVERELVVTRKVLLYSSSRSDLVKKLEEQKSECDARYDVELDLAVEEQTEEELKEESVESVSSIEAFPPLLPMTVPLAPKFPHITNGMEPNFLLDIELEPMSAPEKKFVSIGSLQCKQVENADLNMMLEELDVMQSELGAVMACCTSLLIGEVMG
ncbi:uncharacterized protein PHALS_10338 [Plasmopara halstedii]|uniref:Uncharacterized protein n=1 Tax=Plasmopara halstedii TaxID=4781 RepID=A0A0P1AHH7_PLAHL|nr:uncharacterized protein PHALS_10338 [Plasmopara halstedii]CEG40121.1 hypothetical protein PHALS_10338 [Plasmopara halstedii]|eukprot:XP_024576490.1 hypothetical protein PHALS_10338 [Plasmopara halstedii]